MLDGFSFDFSLPLVSYRSLLIGRGKLVWGLSSLNTRPADQESTRLMTAQTGAAAFEGSDFLWALIPKPFNQRQVLNRSSRVSYLRGARHRSRGPQVAYDR